MPDKAPTLWAYELNDTQWAAWCDHCHILHIHGQGEGHRSSHCFRGGNPKGYYLRFAGAGVPPAIMAAHDEGLDNCYYRYPPSDNDRSGKNEIL